VRTEFDPGPSPFALQPDHHVPLWFLLCAAHDLHAVPKLPSIILKLDSLFLTSGHLHAHLVWFLDDP
jgi:hypothetical protein